MYLSEDSIRKDGVQHQKVTTNLGNSPDSHGHCVSRQTMNDGMAKETVETTGFITFMPWEIKAAKTTENEDPSKGEGMGKLSCDSMERHKQFYLHELGDHGAQGFWIPWYMIKCSEIMLLTVYF